MNSHPNSHIIDAEVGLKFWAGITILMAISAELIFTLLDGKPAFLSFTPFGRDWFTWTTFIGSFAGIPACVLWIGGETPPIRKTWLQLALAIGVGIYVYLMAFKNGYGISSPNTVITICLGPLGLLWMTCSLLAKPGHASQQNDRWKSLYIKVTVLLDMLSVSTHAALAGNRLIFPATWDYFVYRIDAAFFGTATQLASLNATSGPFIQAFTSTSYSLLVVILYSVIGLAIKKKAVARLHVWRTLVMPFALAWFLYALIPLSGPTYAFFDSQFPDNMPTVKDIPTSQVVIPPAFRNAMPSMHLTGALLVWMLSIGLWHRIAILFSSLLVLATAWSTLAQGEHYCLDLVVAITYACFIGPLLIWPHLLRGNKINALTIWLTGATFLSWLLLIRAIPDWLSNNLWFIQLFSVWSLLSSFTVFWRLIVESRITSLCLTANSITEPSNRESTIKAPSWIIAIFAMSGVAGLIYEVVYAKALAVTFGSTAMASYTVLATYMGGMALGAMLGGYIADKTSNPIRTYAICEALIGLYAATTPQLFRLIQEIYVAFSWDIAPESSWLTALRLYLGVACLGLPTILMGATMPLMFKHLRELGVSSRSAIAPLYGANVAGASLGSIIAGYWILPAVGRNSGTFIAAALSLMIALYVLDRAKRPVERPNSANQLGGEILLSNSSAVEFISGIVALSILFVGGAITLGLEVNSMHLLAIVAGNSVYAFGLMLAAFLGGLGLGSYVGERLMNHFQRLNLIAWSQCGLAVAIGMTAQTWDDIPSYFSSFSIYPVHFDFGARETIRAMVCTTAMLPSAFFVGACYPAAMSLASDWLSPKGAAKGLGLASGLNTLGNILGVFMVGFWLLPAYGSRDTSLILGLLALSLGLIATLAIRQNSSPMVSAQSLLRWPPIIAAICSLSLFPNQWNYDELSTGSNVYFSSQNWGKVIDHAESVEGGLTLVSKTSQGISTLLTNGKFQGNDAIGGEMVAQESFALFPLLHTPKRSRALVIGYGTGMTTRVLHESGFKEIDIAELSKDIVTMADRHFSKINHGVANDPSVHMHYTDGRNYLLTQSREFDLISIEITSIWFAGAANLYNKDFYSLAKQRLTRDGVLQQWIQLHHMAEIDLAYVIGSVRSEFKYVWIYVRGGQGIIVASNNSSAENRPSDKTNDDTVEQLRSHLILSPTGVDRFISKIDPSMTQVVSTDSNLYLEHSTPKGNSLGNVVEKNIKLLTYFEPHLN